MNCPNCNNKTFEIYRHENMPYGISLKELEHNIVLNYCTGCGFVFQSSAFSDEYDINIAKLYKSYKITDMYNFPNESYHNLKALNFINEYIENRIDFNVLEIGSNRGDFLYLLKQNNPNINIIGCEPTAFKELKVPTLNAFFNKNLFNTKFDLIILKHTLEHIKNPKLFIKDVFSLLNKNGKVFIEVPNLIYSLNNYIEDFTPDHVNFFSLNTLKSCINKKLLKFDDPEYLYTVFSNENEKKTNDIDSRIEQSFYKYNENYNCLINEIKKVKRVIFYGISNYYLWTFKKLANYIKDKEMFFIDDYLKEDNINNLTKLTNLEDNDLVILCSSNKQIQKKMATNLPKNTLVLYPWEKIEYV